MTCASTSELVYHEHFNFPIPGSNFSVDRNALVSAILAKTYPIVSWIMKLLPTS